MPTTTVSSIRLLPDGTRCRIAFSQLFRLLPMPAFRSRRGWRCAMRHRHRCQSVTVSNLQDAACRMNDAGRLPLGSTGR
jgi:hypothetical protein